MYRVLTDIMGHERLGGNTVLFIVEGLWGGPEAVSKPVKWNMAPFNGDWPSSILAAQDAVALESVCFDLLKTEFKDPERTCKGSSVVRRQWMITCTRLPIQRTGLQDLPMIPKEMVLPWEAWGFMSTGTTRWICNIQETWDITTELN